MQELLKNAVNGWFAYIDAGKYMVLFLGILLYYWYRTACGSKAGCPGGQKAAKVRCHLPGQDTPECLGVLMVYATVMAAMAIFPVTAVLLMKYQTKFYDYRWIWSVVPVTLVAAWGMAFLYLEQYRQNWKGKRLKPVCFVALGLGVILLCGNLHTDSDRGQAAALSRAGCERLLDKLAESGDTDTICMWAPAKVMGHVRELDGSIRLLYGRNMWEASLNAYSYDVYDQVTVELYRWMEELSAPGHEAEGHEAVAAALDKGVNCILIPEEKMEDISQWVSQVAAGRGLTVTQETAEGYCIFRIRS